VFPVCEARLIYLISHSRNGADPRAGFARPESQQLRLLDLIQALSVNFSTGQSGSPVLDLYRAQTRECDATKIQATVVPERKGTGRSCV
jgi:hypothetical protein